MPARPCCSPYQQHHHIFQSHAPLRCYMCWTAVRSSKRVRPQVRRRCWKPRRYGRCAAVYPAVWQQCYSSVGGWNAEKRNPGGDVCEHAIMRLTTATESDIVPVGVASGGTSRFGSGKRRQLFDVDVDVYRGSYYRRFRFGNPTRRVCCLVWESATIRAVASRIAARRGGSGSLCAACYATVTRPEVQTPSSADPRWRVSHVP